MSDYFPWYGTGTGLLDITGAEGWGGWDGWDGGMPVPPPRGPLDDGEPLDTVPHAAIVEPQLVPRHRRRVGPPVVSWSLVLGALFGALTAIMVTAVCLLGWLLCYDPLRDLAESRVPRGLCHLWPVIVYGPWFVGSLSVLRSALEGRRPVHAWVVVLVFSGIATGLCVFEACRAPLNLLDIIVAGLPPITAAVCLHQLVRQLASTPRVLRPQPRHTARRTPR